ncbi:hypothetical protein Btru_019043 [Bulinus truncatus]|nr:hypothetical protein Btru_019043 [Bulinus truncatus]
MEKSTNSRARLQEEFNIVKTATEILSTVTNNTESRLKTIKEMSEQFSKGLEDLERSRQSQQSSLQSELKKMQLLQKKY